MLSKAEQIKGFAGYKINKKGEIFSCKTKIALFGKNHQIIGTKSILTKKYRSIKSSKNSKGYWLVALGGKTKMIHRLVAETFIKKVEGKNLVCHKDGNPNHNNVENLYWGDIKDNFKDAIKHGKLYGLKCKGESHPAHKLTEDNVIEIKKLCKQGIPPKEIAERFGISQATVSDLKLSKRWKYLSKKI